MFLSIEILTDFSTTLVHLKNKTAEPSREIKEPKGLTLGLTMPTLFLQNSLRGRLSLEETVLPSMPLIMLLIPRCTASPEGVHTYPNHQIPKQLLFLVSLCPGKTSHQPNAQTRAEYQP